MLYPLKLNAAFKDYLWGGTRLRDEFNKQTDAIMMDKALSVMANFLVKL